MEKKTDIGFAKEEEVEVSKAEGFFAEPEELVKRGELLEVLSEILQGMNNELEVAFTHIARTVNLVDIIMLALVDKGLINDEDVEKAKQVIIEKQAETRGEEDGSK